MILWTKYWSINSNILPNDFMNQQKVWRLSSGFSSSGFHIDILKEPVSPPAPNWLSPIFNVSAQSLVVNQLDVSVLALNLELNYFSPLWAYPELSTVKLFNANELNILRHLLDLKVVYSINKIIVKIKWNTGSTNVLVPAGL